jgi:hypothetical protein
MALAMKENEMARPIPIRLFSSEAEMPAAAYLIEDLNQALGGEAIDTP